MKMKEFPVYIPEEDYDRVVNALASESSEAHSLTVRERAAFSLQTYIASAVRRLDERTHKEEFVFEEPEVIAPQDWVQPGGEIPAYNKGDVVRHNGSIWVSSTDDNVWEPGVSGWHAYGENPEEGPFPWVEPTGSHDAYQQGDQVTHNGQTWESEISDNVWEPGVHGWVVV